MLLKPVAALYSCASDHLDEFNDHLPEKSLQLLSPNGGEVFTDVESITIHWKAQNIHNINICISFDNGLIWNTAATNISANISNYSLPLSGINSGRCRVKIQNTSDTFIEDTSEAPFTIITKDAATKSIVLTEPATQIALKAGSAYTIRWEAQNITHVSLHISYDNGFSWQIIETNIPNTGTYNWTVPFIISSSARLRVSDANATSIQDTTDFGISIYTEFEINLNTYTQLSTVGGTAVFNAFYFGDFLVKRVSAAEAKSFSLSCTHNGCTINYNAMDQKFYCPCHGAVFLPDGTVESGPANSPLTKYNTILIESESKIIVTSL